jgi:predicted transcriptional regulator
MAEMALEIARRNPSMSDSAATNETLISLTSDIISAHVSHNKVEIAEVPDMIAAVYSALSGLGKGSPLEEVALTPAVAIRNSVKPDYIVCLEDGKKMKMLKRHLSNAYNLTPAQYRQRWNLPADYPMVAPSYAQRRRELAITIGLGRKKLAPEPAPKPVRRRGTKKQLDRVPA